MENLKSGLSTTMKRKPASHRQLFKPENNEESTSDYLTRKIREHNESDHERFAAQYNFDTKRDRPLPPSKNIRWVKTETAPQFYHETTAKSKTQRLLALNSVENLVKNVENLVKNVPKKAVTLKRSQRPLSPNDEPKIKQSKNGLSQRPENISTATRQNISTAPRQKNTIGFQKFTPTPVMKSPTAEEVPKK